MRVKRMQVAPCPGTWRIVRKVAGLWAIGRMTRGDGCRRTPFCMGTANRQTAASIVHQIIHRTGTRYLEVIAVGAA